MESPVLELESVTKRYGRVSALKDVSLQLLPGVSLGLVGRNGAGKTTLLRLLMGLLQPSAGRIRLFGGNPITEAERVKVHVGYMAEDMVFPLQLTPADLFRFFEAAYPTWDRGFLESLIDRFKVPMHRRLSTLSKGVQRQVSFLCAVSHRPRLLILDEPGGGLDPVFRRHFLEEVVLLLLAERTSVLFSSHNLVELERVATRLGVLHEGRLILEEDLDRLREESARVLVDSPRSDLPAACRDLRGFVRASPREGGWVLTLRASPEEAARRVQETLGVSVKDAQPLSLEDLFIAIVEEGP
jgi:ABC-type multidrug transport system ATPase subunit